MVLLEKVKVKGKKRKGRKNLWVFAHYQQGYVDLFFSRRISGGTLSLGSLYPIWFLCFLGFLLKRTILYLGSLNPMDAFTKLYYVAKLIPIALVMQVMQPPLRNTLIGLLPQNL